MATHLYPGVKSNYRSKFSFKPTFYTYEYQRPSEGEPTSPGHYAKEPDHLHLKVRRPPEVRGSCSSSCASHRSSGASSHRGASPSPSSSRSSSPRKGAPVRNEREPMRTAAMLTKIADRINIKAAAEELRAKELNERDLYRKLCVAVHTSVNSKGGGPIIDMVRRWDKQGQGKLTVTEFRMGLRAAPPVGLGIEHDHKDIDLYFDSLDTENDGVLEMPELKAHFNAMNDFAKKALKEAAKIHDLARGLRTKVEMVRDVALRTNDYENEELALATLRSSQPVKVQLGRLLAKKQMKISDVRSRSSCVAARFFLCASHSRTLSYPKPPHPFRVLPCIALATQILLKWDTRGDGEISKAEFRKHARKLGVVATAADMNACFDSIDEDGGGTLDVEELKPAFKELAAAAKASEGAEADQEKDLVAQRKAVKMSQADMLSMISDELRSIAAEDEARRADAALAQASQREAAASPEAAAGAADGQPEAPVQLSPGPDEQLSQLTSQALPMATLSDIKPPSDD